MRLVPILRYMFILFFYSEVGGREVEIGPQVENFPVVFECWCEYAFTSKFCFLGPEERKICYLLRSKSTT